MTGEYEETHLVPGYSLLSDQARRVLPPDIDMDGDLFEIKLRDDGFSIALERTIEDPSEVLETFDRFANPDTALSSTPELFARQLGRLLNSQSMLYKSLSGDLQKFIKLFQTEEYGRFRPQVGELVAWLDEPEVYTEKTHIKKARIIGEDRIVQRPEAPLMSLNYEQTRNLYDGFVSDNQPDLDSSIRALIEEYPELLRTRSGRVFQNSDRLWEQFHKLGNARQANIVRAHIEQLDETQQAELHQIFKRHAYIGPFEIQGDDAAMHDVFGRVIPEDHKWYTERSNGALGRVLHQAPDATVSLTDSFSRNSLISQRRYGWLGAIADLQVEVVNKRRDLIAVVDTGQEKLDDDPEILRSRLVGYLCICILLRQEFEDMPDDERAMIDSYRNENPKLEVATRSALALLMVAKNGTTNTLQMMLRAPGAIDASSR